MQDKEPLKYREYELNLSGIKTNIAGMAGPHNNDGLNGKLTKQEVFQYLKQKGRDVLIGLHESEHFEKEAEAAGLEYKYIPILDLTNTPISPETYDAIYEVVIKAIQEGKSVSIHCGSGAGRTGTAIASLKLHEILERAVKDNPLILDHDPEITTSIFTTWSGRVPCTPFVEKAIKGARQEIVPVGGGVHGIQSVETENDVRTLMNYEKHLRMQMKEMLQKQESLTTETTNGMRRVLR